MDPSAADEEEFTATSRQISRQVTQIDDQDDHGNLGGGPSKLSLDRVFGQEEGALRRMVLNFTPSWFAVNMGTGIVSMLLFNLPYNAVWVYWISVAIFALNVTLFTIFTIISAIRYIMYPDIWFTMLRHPMQSLFLGAFPMGFATIVNMVAYVCVPAWGEWTITLVWILWWIDVAISLMVCLYLPFSIINVHTVQLSTMTAAWLLPIVATIVAAASGSIVAGVLTNKEHALWTIIVSYILWGTGVPLAMSTLVIYFQRLTWRQLPPREAIVSVFLPLGPLGQGGFGIMNLGKVAMTVFPETNTLVPSAGTILFTMGWFIGIIMWGYGLIWGFFAISSISKARFPFNMGWWGFTFPIGVYAASTVMIGKELPSRFFAILGTILSLSVLLLWMFISMRTIQKTLTGEFFPSSNAPDSVEDEKRKRGTLPARRTGGSNV